VSSPQVFADRCQALAELASHKATRNWATTLSVIENGREGEVAKAKGYSGGRESGLRIQFKQSLLNTIDEEVKEYQRPNNMQWVQRRLRSLQPPRNYKVA
jgi:hypothetical protein